MEDTSTEGKFQAAVELIKNLPKSGSFHPSNDLKLKFYSYYKQATEGPCEIPKPGFWDIINRAKWDAWKGLGDMPKEEAMEHYVEEFFRIVKNTPYDENAKPFMDMMEPLMKYAPKELLESQQRVNGSSGHDDDDFEEDEDPCYSLNESVELNNPKAKYFKNKDMDSKKSDIPDQVAEGIPEAASAVNGHNINGSNDSDSEEFSDTFDKVNEDSADEDLVSKAAVADEQSCNPSICNAKGTNIVHVRGGGDQRSSARDANSPVSGASGNRSHRQSYQGRGLDSSSLNAPSSSMSGSSGGNRRSGGNATLEPPADVSEQLALAVIKLQHTMDQVVSRLDSLETLLQERKNNPCRQVSKMNSSFWSMFGISPRAALLILAWPFVAHWLMYVIQKRRRR